MSEVDVQTKRAEVDASRAGVSKRIVEWFWRGSALAQLRQSITQDDERARRLAERARASAEVASLALLAEPLSPTYGAIVCELHRQGAYWAASALSGGPAPNWEEFEESLFMPPEGGVTTSESLRELVRTGSFSHFAELPADELYRARISLCQLDKALFAKWEERSLPSRRLRAQRIARLSLLLVSLISLIVAAVWIRDVRLQQSELIAGKSWTASSSYGAGGCDSPAQLCPGNTGYFFHTSMEDRDPWIEFDLAATQQVSSVKLENREDCCMERAVPVAVEVSLDHQNWQVVARRDVVFSTWRASFEPVKARWVRLHLLARTGFHLYRVRMYP